MSNQNLSDQAELLAEGLGILPDTYAGREGDAIVALTLLAGYRRMVPSDQAQILYRIDDLHLGPAFMAQARATLAMTIVNPVWVPGAMSNDEVLGELAQWRSVSKWLTLLGYSTGVGGALGKAGQTIFNKALDGGGAAVKGLLNPKNIARAGAAVLGYAAQSIAQQAIADMGAEAARRGKLGTMSPLHVERATQ